MNALVDVLGEASPVSWAWLIASQCGIGYALLQILSSRPRDQIGPAIKRGLGVSYGFAIVLAVLLVRRNMADFWVMVLGLALYVFWSFVMVLVGPWKLRRMSAEEQSRAGGLDSDA